eukprot:1232466-Pyramimonas_sp.AAC.1
MEAKSPLEFQVSKDREQEGGWGKGERRFSGQTPTGRRRARAGVGTARATSNKTGGQVKLDPAFSGAEGTRQK